METHNHCQCDNCSGVDCGADDPEKKETEDNRIARLKRNAVLDTVIDAITAKLDDKDRNWKGMQKAIKIVSDLRSEP